MYIYKVTCLFQADWVNLYPAIFGGVEHSYSENGSQGPNVANYGFLTPQTPADLGPLVKVELISQ
jgi:hypothetical protein